MRPSLLDGQPAEKTKLDLRIIRPADNEKVPPSRFSALLQLVFALHRPKSLESCPAPAGNGLQLDQNESILSARQEVRATINLTIVGIIGQERTVHEVAISEFKAKCLALLEEVHKTKKALRITRFGKPIAVVIPPTTVQPRDTWIGSMKDSMQILGDIISPANGESEWEVLRD